MTRDETVNIIRIITASYPNYKPDNISETVNVWNAMLNNYTYNEIAYALKQYILADTKGFAPSIGQLVDILNKGKETKKMQALEKKLLPVNGIGKIKTKVTKLLN